ERDLVVLGNGLQHLQDVLLDADAGLDACDDPGATRGGARVGANLGPRHGGLLSRKGSMVPRYAQAFAATPPPRAQPAARTVPGRPSWPQPARRPAIARAIDWSATTYITCR